MKAELHVLNEKIDKEDGFSEVEEEVKTSDDEDQDANQQQHHESDLLDYALMKFEDMYD